MAARFLSLTVPAGNCAAAADSHTIIGMHDSRQQQEALCIARRLTIVRTPPPFTQVGNGILNTGTKVTAGQLTCNGAAPGSIPLPSCFKVDANTQVRRVRKGKWIGSQRGVVDQKWIQACNLFCIFLFNFRK
jgi:hypothetical protein